MSAASVRRSGRRNSFPLLRRAAGNGRKPGSLARPFAVEVFVQQLLEFFMDGKLLFFEAERKPFPRRIIVFDLEVHDRADPGEGIRRQCCKFVVEAKTCVDDR